MLEVRTFLDTLWPNGLPDGTALNLWEGPPSKNSNHFASIDAAVEWLEAHENAEHDIYFGVCAMRAGLQPWERGVVADARALPGLWLDVDFAGDGHKKKNYPPDQKTALALLDKLPLKPSLVIFTGGGLHAYWLFKEAWELDDVERAGNISAGWQQHVMSAFAPFAIDSTFDLPRVLRLPGLVNRKYGKVTRILRSNQFRYSPSDFEVYIPERVEDRAVHSVDSERIDSVRLDEDRELPPKLQSLLDADKKAKKLWETGMPESGTDKSQSAADLALATKLAHAGFTEQEVADIIGHWRRERDEKPEKALREGYMKPLLAKAFAEVGARVAMRKAADGEEVAEDEVEALRQTIANQTGLRVVRIIQHGLGADTFYELELDGDRRLAIGDTKAIRSLASWGNALFSYRIPWVAPTTEAWQEIREMLLLLVEEADPTERESTRDQALAILRKFMGEVAEKKVAVANEGPFVENGRLYFRLEKLQQRANVARNWELGGSRSTAAAVVRGQLHGGNQNVWANGTTLSYFWVPLDEVTDDREDDRAEHPLRVVR